MLCASLLCQDPAQPTQLLQESCHPVHTATICPLTKQLLHALARPPGAFTGVPFPAIFPCTVRTTWTSRLWAERELVHQAERVGVELSCANPERSDGYITVLMGMIYLNKIRKKNQNQPTLSLSHSQEPLSLLPLLCCVTTPLIQFLWPGWLLLPQVSALIIPDTFISDTFTKQCLKLTRSHAQTCLFFKFDSPCNPFVLLLPHLHFFG